MSDSSAVNFDSYEDSARESLRASKQTLLIEIHYTPMFLNLAPIQLIGQIVNSGSLSYIWIDGLDRNDPILVPVTNAPGPRHLGTLDAYYRTNEEAFHEIVGSALSRDLILSSLLIVRSVEAMKIDHSGPDRAIDTALTWSRMLLELDEMERHAFNQAFAEAAAEVRLLEV